MSSGKTCSVDNCGRPHRSKGWCQMHYARVLRHGSPGDAQPQWEPIPGDDCQAPGCEKTRRVGERYCHMHAARRSKHGDINVVHRWGPGVDSQRWQGDDIAYHSAHARVHRLKGKASNHSCVNCGARAADWAYDHQDESEKVGPAHNGGGVVSIVRYSTDPDHYQPMCKCCHRKFDADERKSNRAELAQPELGSGDQR